ncbi:MAG: hypothetical protein E5X80_09235 [Mesorhizobium sp.]|uniref:hypothetical protein n=1 Tax=Mesorhizobium sp. TaxID=1871066 RepID=UPI00122BFAAC|nr:hypothetical protein [Mesorhizobium sp.]TIO51303.1 MAG: hypothetical protein E5X78_17515 [Mesorhizobium sp.]TIO59189.1 MAG: hypothetical protein E5X79_18165 [Mesorhizobium sp.]TJV65773.1 MAG: hypothetical protein E5X80_09235 [Mesorhizobium sp.]
MRGISLHDGSNFNANVGMDIAIFDQTACMLKWLYDTVSNRVVLGLLYFFIFAGFALLGQGLRIAHWIFDHQGSWSLLGWMIGYTAIMVALIWATDKVTQNMLILRLPPSNSLSEGAYVIEERASYDEDNLKLKNNGMIKPGS